MVSDKLGDRITFSHGSELLSGIDARVAYSSDASIYSVMPECVVMLRSPEDVPEIIKYAGENKLPITPRSGGTSLSGSAVGKGLIIDASPLDSILEVNPKEMWVRVQPGMVFDEVNAELERYGVWLGVDPSSGEMCKIGGTISTNASGPHSLRYGAMKGSVIELEVWLADGSRLRLKDCMVGSTEFDELMKHDALKKSYDIISKDIDLILSHRLKVRKNIAGYNLFDVAEGIEKGVFSPQRLLVGSEGTLCIVTEAKLKLYPLPERITTLLAYLPTLDRLGPAVNLLLALDPSAIEVADRYSLDLIGRERFDIPKEAEVMLLIEFDHRDQDERALKADEGLVRLGTVGKVERASDPEFRTKLWSARKGIFPTLYKYDPRKKPLHFIDDTVVPPERLAEFIAFVSSEGERLGVQVPMFGHAGEGNVHINPLIDPTTTEGIEAMKQLYEKVNDKAIELGGTVCGEHGEGRVRARLLPKVYGEEVYALFREIKKAFDPDGLLNPGVKLSSVPFTENMAPVRLIKQCASCGKCVPFCPVSIYGEQFGARGRFAILTSEGIPEDIRREVADLCLNCKNCRGLCPAGVDVSSIVVEERSNDLNPFIGFIAWLRDKERLFGALVKTAARSQSVWDTPSGRRFVSALIGPVGHTVKRGANMDPKLRLPKIAKRTLRERNEQHVRDRNARVAYFHGCAANFFDNYIGDSVLSVLSKSKVEFDVPEQRCCGIPFLTYGDRNAATENAKFNIDSLSGYDTIVTSCGSCHLMLKDYHELFKDDPEYSKKAMALASRVKDVAEFAMENVSLRQIASTEKVTFHMSCHLKVAGVTAQTRILKAIYGGAFVPMTLQDHCAGCGGTFFLKDFETSQKIFERKRRSIEDTRARTVVTGCPSCMIQLETGAGDIIRVKHIAQIIDDAL